MIVLRESDRLLFQGDSITHGGRGENQWDLNHVLGHGYQSILAGRLLFENRAHLPEIINRGVSGDTTGKLLERWETDTLALRPTVLSLLVGVNNSGSQAPDADRVFNEELCALLEQTKAACPEIRLILCEPFAFAPPGGGDDGQERIGRVRSFAAHTFAAAERFHAVFVPFWRALAPYVNACPEGSVIWDGVHPTVLGHEIMARCWYRTVDASGILR